MTEAGKRNEVRNFCATFFNALAIGGVAAAIFGFPDNPHPTEYIDRAVSFMFGMASFMVGYYIMNRTETTQQDD